MMFHISMDIKILLNELKCLGEHIFSHILSNSDIFGLQ